MAVRVRRKAQIAASVEASEGTAETLDATDATMVVFDPQFSINRESFDQMPARADLSKLKALTGIVESSVTFRVALKGSGSISTAPSWAPLIRGAGLAQSAVSKIAIGAVSSGPFEPGETITFTGGAGGVGRVVGECANGDGFLYYVLVSGTATNGDTIAGAISGAGATAGGSPTAAQGFEYLVSSSAGVSLTIALYMDGMRHLIYGARANMNLVCVVGQPVFMEFTVTGIYGGTTDTALLAPTYEEVHPQVFLDVGFSIHGYAAVFSNLAINLNNVLSRRPNANKATGIESFFIASRGPTGTLNMEFPLVASHDVLGRMVGDNLGRMAFNLSDSAGNNVWVASPGVQYDATADGDQGGAKAANANFSLRTDEYNVGDRDLQIAVI